MIFRRRRKTPRGTGPLVELSSVMMENGDRVPVIYPVGTPLSEKDSTFIENWMNSFGRSTAALHTKTGGSTDATSHS